MMSSAGGLVHRRKTRGSDAVGEVATTTESTTVASSSPPCHSHNEHEMVGLNTIDSTTEAKAVVEEEDYTKIPYVLQAWCRIDASFPFVSFFGVNMSIALTSFVMFIVIRVLMEIFLVRVCGMEPGHVSTKATVKSLVSTIHGCVMVPSMWCCLRSSPRKFNPSEKLDKSPLWLQQSIHAIFQFTTGYMCYDQINIFLRARARDGMKFKDMNYIIHHNAAWVFPTLTRIFGAGHMTFVMCSFLGEITQPLKDVAHAARQAMLQECCKNQILKDISHICSFTFSIIYLPFRVLIGPAICMYMTYHHYKYGRKHIPTLVLLVMNGCIWGILLSSWSWIVYSYKTLIYFYDLWQYHRR